MTCQSFAVLKGIIPRKAASAQIAKIPLPLSQWIARCYKPVECVA